MFLVDQICAVIFVVVVGLGVWVAWDAIRSKLRHEQVWWEISLLYGLVLLGAAAYHGALYLWRSLV